VTEPATAYVRTGCLQSETVLQARACAHFTSAITISVAICTLYVAVAAAAGVLGLHPAGWRSARSCQEVPDCNSAAHAPCPAADTIPSRSLHDVLRCPAVPAGQPRLHWWLLWWLLWWLICRLFCWECVGDGATGCHRSCNVQGECTCCVLV
jgi:hypothetical protein